MYYFERNTMALATIFGAEDAAEAYLAEIADLVEEAKELGEELTEEDKALIILYSEGSIRAHGPGSRFGIIHDVIGIPYVDGDLEIITHGTVISNEAVVAYDPEMLFIFDRGAVVTNGVPMNREDIENELIRLTRGYRNGNLFYMNNEAWYIAPGGLQSVRIQIEEVKAALEVVLSR